MKAFSPLLPLFIALLLASCGGGSGAGGGATPDPFADIFREGIYTREDNGDSYEIRFGVQIGIYSLTVNGEERRRGSFTLGYAPDPVGQADLTRKRVAMVDRPESPTMCAPEQEPGGYEWDFDDNKLKLTALEEECEQRKDDLDSDDWLYQGPLPTTPAPMSAP
jgi:hypothetical protein